MVKFPFIISISLLAWAEVAVSLSVHVGHVQVLIGSSSHWVEDIFCILDSLSWDTELHLATLGLVWPVVTTLITPAEWLSDMRRVLVLLDIVELVLETGQVLSFDQVLHVF